MERSSKSLLTWPDALSGLERLAQHVVPMLSDTPSPTASQVGTSFCISSWLYLLGVVKATRSLESATTATSSERAFLRDAHEQLHYHGICCSGGGRFIRQAIDAYLAFLQEEEDSDDHEEAEDFLAQLLYCVYDVQLLSSFSYASMQRSVGETELLLRDKASLAKLFWAVNHYQGAQNKKHTRKALKIVCEVFSSLPQHHNPRLEVVRSFLDGTCAFQRVLDLPSVSGEYAEVYSDCFRLYAEYFSNDEEFPPPKVIGLLEEAAAITPRQADIWAHLGSQYLQLVQAHIEDPEEELLAANDARAQRCYTAARDLAPADAEIQAQSGELQYLLLRLETSRTSDSYAHLLNEAVGCFEAACRLDPSSWRMWVFLGKSREKQGWAGAGKASELLEIYSQGEQAAKERNECKSAMPFFRKHRLRLRLLLQLRRAPWTLAEKQTLLELLEKHHAFDTTRKTGLAENATFAERQVCVLEDCMEAMRKCSGLSKDKSEDVFHPALYQLATALVAPEAPGNRRLDEAVEVMSKLFNEKKSSRRDYVALWRDESTGWELLSKQPGKYAYYCEKYLKFWIRLLCDTTDVDRLSGALHKLRKSTQANLSQYYPLVLRSLFECCRCLRHDVECAVQADDGTVPSYGPAPSPVMPASDPAPVTISAQTGASDDKASTGHADEEKRRMLLGSAYEVYMRYLGGDIQEAEVQLGCTKDEVEELLLACYRLYVRTPMTVVTIKDVTDYCLKLGFPKFVFRATGRRRKTKTGE